MPDMLDLARIKTVVRRCRTFNRQAVRSGEWQCRIGLTLLPDARRHRAILEADGAVVHAELNPSQRHRPVLVIGKIFFTGPHDFYRSCAGLLMKLHRCLNRLADEIHFELSAETAP